MTRKSVLPRLARIEQPTLDARLLTDAAKPAVLERAPENMP